MATEFNNRQAFFNYFIESKYEAGVVLLGTEVKSIREGKLSFNDAFCLIDNNEVWLRGLYIAEYKLGTVNNHIAVHDRKLLLKKREIKRLQAATKEKGLTLIPLRVYINDTNLVKVEFGIAKGKKLHDKRDTIKKRDNDRELKQYLN
ncbi:MAG: SsrA-binding protein SmpB [Bacteroidetes bacterium]|nr:SsrA-binding protein SmpB [Bacteroidota bacterium]